MSLLRELRYSLRTILRSPLFASVAVLSLALGIGANAAVFTLLNQVVLRYLPVKDPAQLAQLKEVGDFYGSNTGFNSLPYPVYRDISEQNRVFSGMFCRASIPLSISFGGRSERATGEVVSGTYFPVLGVRPALGRVFNARDDQTRSGAPYAVLGYAYWRSRFGGDPGVIGKELLANSHKLRIVGVAAPGFSGVQPLTETEVYVPVMMAAEIAQQERPFDNRGRRWLQVFGRLKPGVTRAAAKASLAPLFRRMLLDELREARFAHASPYSREVFLRLQLDVRPGGGGQNFVRDFLQAPLWSMMAMVGLVLLIACANVANLMLARGAARQREIAIRVAIGAGRMQIVRQMLLESLILAGTGGVVGLLLSALGLRLVTDVMPRIEPPIRLETLPDGGVLLFALAASVCTALVFGLLPALQATRPDLAPTLKDQASAVAGGGISVWRKLLVAAQVSLSLLLLIAAGLFVSTLQNLKNVSPGFEVGRLVSFSVDPTLGGYTTARAKQFYRQLTEKLQAVPGVESAAVSVVAPLSFDEWDSTVTVEGYTAKRGEDMSVHQNYVSPGFLQTLKIALLAGRDFSERDAPGSPKVAVVNEKFARRYFGNGNPIGRHIGWGGDPGSGTKTDIEIVGLVRDTKYETMRASAPEQVFQPYLQNDWAVQMTAYVRTGLAAPEIFPQLRSAVRKLDANLPVFQMKTEERQVEDVLAVERLTARLAFAFGALATVLAGIGLYGVMAFLVARRSREIGIRMALGALRVDVLRTIMGELLLLATLGVAIGLPLALAGARLIRSQLYGVSAADPLTIALAILGIVLVAGLAGYVPARRAMKVDPVQALRYE